MVHGQEPWPWAEQVSEGWARCVGARDAASERARDHYTLSIQYTEGERPLYRVGQHSSTLSVTPSIPSQIYHNNKPDCYNASESFHISHCRYLSILAADQSLFFASSILFSFSQTSMALIQPKAAVFTWAVDRDSSICSCTVLIFPLKKVSGYTNQLSEENWSSIE